MRREDFGDDFVWGVSTAAYQIEGAAAEDGKGKSIWDTFSHRRGKIARGENGDVACDHYHRFEADLDLMASLGIRHYRLSLAWARLLPAGVGPSNPKGVDFYKRLIDACLGRGITPWVTLYHWDLPQALQERGGWTNRDILGWFEEFAALAAKSFGDRVKNWMVLNEPLVISAAGHLLGVHAPGKRGLRNFLPAVHHAALITSRTGRLLRELVPDGNLGTTFSCSAIEPFRDNERDRKAARRYDAVVNRLFIEPLVGLGYPMADAPFLRKIEKYVRPGDMEALPFQFDFIGVQNYTREIVKFSPFYPYAWGRFVGARKRNVDHTEMGWEVFPESLYRMLKLFAAYPGVKRLLVTENGAAFQDVVANGKVDDPRRVDYLKRYVEQVRRARQEGVPVKGYFVWSFLDNFEWAEGYRPRFGLVYVDYRDQTRIPKSSAYWYRDFIKG